METIREQTGSCQRGGRSGLGELGGGIQNKTPKQAQTRYGGWRLPEGEVGGGGGSG